MTRADRRAVGLAATAVLLLLTGGAAAETPAPGTAPAGTTGQVLRTSVRDYPHPVILPGRPGEPAVEITRADPAATAATARYNALDVAYVRMMIPHHTQALQLAALAPERAGDPRIRVLAERIRASQLPEILRMRGWLAARGLALDDEHGAHEHGAMRGMQTPAAVDRLAAARGADFDRLFVQMMVDHHQGAIEMSTDVLRVGVDTAVEEMATAAASEQAVEIGRMRDLLAD
jgi:uncharacterized protein (DUF305 family)